MKNKNFQIITVLLTSIFSLILFAKYLPNSISRKYNKIVAHHKEPDAKNKKIRKKKYAKISDDLIRYVQKKRETALSETDQLKNDEILELLNDFHKEFNQPSKDLLKQRFSRFANKDLSLDSDSSAFQVPEGIADIVEFWVHIFGIYNRNHVVFYNQDDVSIVYSVLDFSDLKSSTGGSKRSIKSQMMKQERIRLKKSLRKIAKLLKDHNKSNIKLSDLTEEEKRIFQLLVKKSGHVNTDERSLEKSFAYRFGFAHRIKKAINTSGRYLPEMKRIFKEQGLPQELTTIPFIESAFNPKAYSHAGAAGIWQFISATGRRYLRIDDTIDERYDPILATYAAAAHLSKEYELLGSWPLTINAYNTGPGRVLKAKKQLKTNNISKIIKYFKGGGYGFDSRNYFPEFLAALEVVSNQEKYFGIVPKQPEHNHEYVMLPASTNLKQLARTSGLKLSTIRALNLAIKEPVFNGQKNLPKGSLIKIPAHQKENVILAAQELYMNQKYASYHVVKKGDDLDAIAMKYDVSVNKLMETNQILPGQDIKKGAILKLPSDESPSVTTMMDSNGRIKINTIKIKEPKKKSFLKKVF